MEIKKSSSTNQWKNKYSEFFNLSIEFTSNLLLFIIQNCTLRLMESYQTFRYYIINNVSKHFSEWPFFLAL